MAVKSHFSEADFIEILLAYELGTLKASQSLTTGTVQTNYRLQTTRGRYVFRFYENRPLGSVLFESHLIQYLTAHQYPCPAAFPNRQGAFVGSYREKPYLLFEFVEGEHLERLTADQKSQLIQKVAELHLITQAYEPRYQDHRWNYDGVLCRRLAQDTAAKLDPPTARAKLAWFEAELAALDLPDSLPKGICHCDFDLSNILFQDGQFKALLDFDDANYTYLIFDLAGLINPFVPPFDWDSWSAFDPDADVLDFRESKTVVQEYSHQRPLTDVEKAHLFDVYKLTVLFDCIWYFARGALPDFYEKRKLDALNRLGRSGFYQALFD